MNLMQTSSARKPSHPHSASTRAPLRWWIAWSRLTAPADPPSGASFPELQMAQRGRITSFLLLLVASLLLAGLLVEIVTAHLTAALLVGILLLLALVLAVLNRRGKVTIVGLILWIAITIGIDLMLWSSGVLSPAALPLCGMLVISEVLAALVLPLPFVPIAALCNSLFALLALALMPRSSLLASLLAPGEVLICGWDIILYGVVAGGLWLLIKSGERMNKAEEVAQLKLALLRERQGRERLEEVLSGMEQTLRRILDGALPPQMPLPPQEDTPLGSLTVVLNHLLERMRRLTQVQASHQAMLPLMANLEQVEGMQAALRQDVARAERALRVAGDRQQPVQLGAPRAEALEPLFRALRQKYVLPSSRDARQP